jgi:mono/diheme cytochrome c family protein
MKQLSVFCWILAVAALAACLLADARGTQGDATELGSVSFNNSCLVCHGRAVVYGRALTPAQWTSEVEKMQGWGARVLPEEREPLLNFLKALRPQVEHRPAKLIDKRAWDGKIASSPADAHVDHGHRVYEQSCAACHGVDARGGEPGNNLVETPILLDDTSFHQAVARGRNRMPAFHGVVSEADSRDVLAWLRGLHYDPGN